MKLRQVFVVPLLGLLLVLAQAGVTAPAILERASQLINLHIAWNFSATPPINYLHLSDLNQRLPDGTAQPFSLPANTVFMLTKANCGFTATDPNLSGDMLFTIGNYYRARLTMTNGRIGINDAIPLGIPISDLNATFSVTRFGEIVPTPISGTFRIRLLGYLAPNN